MLLGQEKSKQMDRPTTKITVGTTSVECLWDTGSQISLIDHRVMSKLSTQNPGKIRRLPDPDGIVLRTAAGKKMDVLSLYHVEIKTKFKVISGAFYVVRNLAVDMLIGCDIMNEHQIELNLGQRKIKIGQKIRKQEFESGGEVLKLHTAILLKPKEERQIICKLPDSFKNLREVYFEAVPFDSEIIIPDAVCGVNDGRIQLVALNLSKDNKYIKQYESIGKLYKKPHFTEYEIDSIAKEVKVDRKLGPEFTIKDLQLDGVPAQYTHEYLQLVNDYRDVFSRDSLDIGDCPIMPHVIKLKDPTKVVSIPPYRMPYHLQDVANNYIENLLKANIIRKSTSPFSSPLMLVRKASADPEAPISQQYRIVHNYKKVNENIERCAYPLRNLYELIDNVSKGKVYTVIDLSQGYFNQRCSDPFGATAFSLPGKGHFEYVKSPMGINSSPAFFQRLLDYITLGLKHVYVYMDDVIISTATHRENLLALKETLKRFRKYKMKCNIKKTKFGCGRVEYLGYDISHTLGIRPGKMKTEAIKKFKPPESVTEIKQFLGLCSFFRRVVPKFSFISAPLSALTRKTSGYSKGPLPTDAQSAFYKLQKALVERPCVSPVDFDKPFILTVDTSKVACGGILSQKGPDGIERANAYFSSVLNPCDANKSAFHREQLGILQALKHFKPYLFGKAFILRTDHKPLTTAQTGKLDILDRIAERIKEFEPFTWEYMKGEIIPSDYLSRPNVQTVKENFAVTQDHKKNQFFSDMAQLRKINWPEAQKLDKRIKALAIKIKFKSRPVTQILRSFVNTWSKACKILDNVVVDRKNRIFVPEKLKAEVMAKFHNNLGHKGKQRTIEQIAKRYVWPEMRQDVENFVASCDTCNKVKPPHEYKVAPLKAFPTVSEFNQRVHLDCLTNLTPSIETGHTAILIMVDAYSGYTLVKSIKSPNAAEVERVFMNYWIAKFTTPQQIITDGGREFQNKVVQEICEKFKIEHITTSPYHSRSNGLAERKVRQVVEFLRLYLEDSNMRQNEWEQLLIPFELITNVYKSERKFSPHFLVFNQEPRLPLYELANLKTYAETSLADKLRKIASVAKIVEQSYKEQFSRNEKYHNRKAVMLELEQGDKVYVNEQGKHLNKLQPKYSGPYLVIEQKENTVILKEPHKRKLLKVHLDRIKVGTKREQFHDIPDKPELHDVPLTQSPRRLPVDPVIFDDDEDEGGPQEPRGNEGANEGANQHQPGPGGGGPADAADLGQDPPTPPGSPGNQTDSSTEEEQAGQEDRGIPIPQAEAHREAEDQRPGAATPVLQPTGAIPKRAAQPQGNVLPPAQTHAEGYPDVRDIQAGEGPDGAPPIPKRAQSLGPTHSGVYSVPRGAGSDVGRTGGMGPPARTQAKDTSKPTSTTSTKPDTARGQAPPTTSSSLGAKAKTLKAKLSSPMKTIKPISKLTRAQAKLYNVPIPEDKISDLPSVPLESKRNKPKTATSQTAKAAPKMGPRPQKK